MIVSSYILLLLMLLFVALIMPILIIRYCDNRANETIYILSGDQTEN